MYIIYILFFLFFLYFFTLIYTLKENKTIKFIENFNYKYIKNFNEAEIILLYDYIYKLITIKKPLQLKKEYEDEGADFIKRIKKIIEYKLYLIKTNREHPLYINKYKNKDAVSNLLYDMLIYFNNVPIEKYILIEKRAHYIHKHKECIKDYITICNLSALYQNGVPPPPDVSDYY